MPIGATIGAAVVGTAGSIYSSSKAAKAQKEAAEQASQVQSTGLKEAAAIQAQSAKDNNIFAEHMYDRNEGWLSPTIMGGWAAGDQIMGLLLGEGSGAGKTGMAPNGWYPNQAPPKVSSTPGAPGGPPAPTAQQSLDAWYTGALNALLPNITQADNLAAINAAATPEAKLAAALAISPPSSDQYPAYAAYVAANPKPAPPPAGPAPTTPPAPAPAPGGTPATNAVVAQQPLSNNAVAAVAPAPAATTAPAPNAVATAATAPRYPKPSDFMDETGDLDTAAYLAAKTAHNQAIGFDPRGSNGWGNPPPAAPPGATPPATTPPAATPPGTAPPATTPPATAPNNAVAAADAWETWKNSTQYTNRLNAGLDAVGTKYAAAGAFESGAEKKAITEYGQMFASNELALYMDNLYRQQALGASAASSLAGVGTNLVSQVSANNQNAANAQAGAAVGTATNNGNAILQAGQSSANQWNNIGGAIGTAAGGVAAAFQPAPNNAVAGVPAYMVPAGLEGAYPYVY